MSIIVPSFYDAIVVREADAVVLGMAQLSTRLLADSNATGGALSVMRTTMGEGIEGARPHTHSKSAELFYVLDGQLQLLAGSQVITAGKGDLVVVPPDMAYAVHQHWPGSHLWIVPDGGHASMEPPLASQLAKATAKLAQQLRS